MNIYQKNNKHRNKDSLHFLESQQLPVNNLIMSVHATYYIARQFEHRIYIELLGKIVM